MPRSYSLNQAKKNGEKMGNLEPLDKIHKEGYNGFTSREKNERDQ